MRKFEIKVSDAEFVTLIGTGWHIHDETGTLYINSENGGNVAAFPRGGWLFIIENELTEAKLMEFVERLRSKQENDK